MCTHNPENKLSPSGSTSAAAPLFLYRRVPFGFGFFFSEVPLCIESEEKLALISYIKFHSIPISGRPCLIPLFVPTIYCRKKKEKLFLWSASRLIRRFVQCKCLFYFLDCILVGREKTEKKKIIQEYRGLFLGIKKTRNLGGPI